MASAILRRVAATALGLSFLVTSVPATAQPAPSGRIKAAVGSASIVRNGQSIPARVGDPVLASDVLRTGPDGQLAVMLKDESRLSMGPGSELALAAFDYAPAESRLSLILRMTRGMLSYVSGRIAKLMPEAVRLETPTSVIGVRGTHALIKVDAP